MARHETHDDYDGGTCDPETAWNAGPLGAVHEFDERTLRFLQEPGRQVDTAGLGGEAWRWDLDADTFTPSALPPAPGPDSDTGSRETS